MYQLLHKSGILLLYGTIITESEAQGDYVPFKRFLIRADIMDSAALVAALPDQISAKITHWQAS